jgi:histidine triad (HIT) family protein
MASPFSLILEGKDIDFVIAENPFFIAVLEKNPLVLGHVVVIAKREVNDVFDLQEDELRSILIFAKPIAQAIRGAVPCVKVGMAVVGLQTRHAHLHLVPIQTAADLDFTRPKLSPEEGSLREVLSKIRAGLPLSRS